MTPQKPTPARAHITPAGLMFLAITSVGWGFNWPVTKYLLSELPPLTMRGSTGVVGAALLAGLAILRGQSLRVPREMWNLFKRHHYLSAALHPSATCFAGFVDLSPSPGTPGEAASPDSLGGRGGGSNFKFEI